MITLTKDQLLFKDQALAVVEGGNYNDTDLVEVYRLAAPSQVTAFHALYISTGEYP